MDFEVMAIDTTLHADGRGVPTVSPSSSGSTGGCFVKLLDKPLGIWRRVST
jgi:hypothetical protein